MKVIIGLGNPGKRYEKTRHNAGFMVVDHLAQRLNVQLTTRKFKALLAETFVKGEKVILVKPQTYMNLSGQCIKPFIDFYKIPLENVLVIYDDMDVEIENIKIRKKGGPGTHNGAKSVVHELVSEDFPRIRVGVGKPIDEYDAIDYVIGKLDEEQYKKLEVGINRASEAAIYYIEHGIDNTMNKFN